MNQDNKKGRLLRAEAKRSGDRVTLDFVLEVDAEILKSVLPTLDAVLNNNPTIPEEWKAQLGDFFDNIRAATATGGEA